MLNQIVELLGMLKKSILQECIRICFMAIYRAHYRHLWTYSFKPKSVCLHVVSWTIGWNVTKFARLYKLDMINSLLDFGDLDLIFKVTASWLKLPPETGLGGGGHLFSLKTLLYFLMIFFIPRHTKSGRVLCYTLRTLSVRPSSARPSVRQRFVPVL